MECGKQFLLLRRKYAGHFYYAFLPLLCKSWVCEKCRRIKAGKVRNFIEKSFAGKPLWMLSLTYFHGTDPEAAWKKIGETCNRMLTYARKYSGTFDYIRIVEPHADGLWPHVHVLCTKPIATSHFVKLVTQWGFGWNFHSMPSGSDLAARYVSKYLTKKWPAGDAELMRVISRTRIVSCSRSLGAIFASENIWELVDYDRDPEQSRFLCNFIIDKCKSANCSFVISRPFSSGWLIETDVELRSAILSEIPDQYCWLYCTDLDYKFMPYGLQEDLFLK